VTETTAQDAPGSTIAAWDDLRVGVVFAAGEIVRAPEAVDAAGPVDAKNAPTGPWKTADGFPQAPTAILVFLIGEKKGPNRGRDQPTTMTECRCGRQRRFLCCPVTGRNSCR
jgi:hypothetical protein